MDVHWLLVDGILEETKCEKQKKTALGGYIEVEGMGDGNSLT